ncbi:hypothetical protein K2173_001381 [Erythroxylum novogranatense]|uniref:X8 domain-containing protein n=1 Tax=Erythroxylum novogranatense TaxID=1862640 RepID=A0AAV8T4Z4_9ROSI|nr:hypothetical protein K2173_001381 [Erythroxylum novogranatense]
MGFAAFQYLFICHFFLLVSSGTGLSQIPPLETYRKTEFAGDQENKTLFSTPYYDTQHDTTPGTVPVINPTTPISTPSVPESPSPPIGITTPTNPPATTTPTTSGGSWCIASPTASDTALQVALDYACGYGGADCSAIQPAASCYDPNTVRDHASYAFNDYYRKNPVPTSCVFGGTAQLSSTDPSKGNCHFASARTTPSLSLPANPTTITTSPPPPSTMNPTITSPTVSSPYGPTVYGVAGPTGQPSSATSVLCNLLTLFSAAGILGSLFVENHV